MYKTLFFILFNELIVRIYALSVNMLVLPTTFIYPNKIGSIKVVEMKIILLFLYITYLSSNMKTILIETEIKVMNYNELNEEDRRLVDVAQKATQRSYAPYSKFQVGAAVLLDNGVMISGTNQENAAYPSGLCAERTALFYANSQYPDAAVKALAIAARDAGGFVEHPITPCGACRQVLLEAETRFKSPIRIILSGKDVIYEISNAGSLLPLAFSDNFILPQ